MTSLSNKKMSRYKKTKSYQKRFTKEQVKQALTDARGFVTKASGILGCSHQTIYNFINKYEDVREHKKLIDEEYLDLAENKLLTLVNEKNLGAICFYLKCKGKDRGYVEKQQTELTNPDGSFSKIKIVGVDELEK